MQAKLFPLVIVLEEREERIKALEAAQQDKVNNSYNVDDNDDDDE